MKINICRDPALVDATTLRVRSRWLELHAWRWGFVVFKPEAQ